MGDALRASRLRRPRERGVDEAALRPGAGAPLAAQHVRLPRAAPRHPAHEGDRGAQPRGRAAALGQARAALAASARAVPQRAPRPRPLGARARRRAAGVAVGPARAALSSRTVCARMDAPTVTIVFLVYNRRDELRISLER